MPRTRACKRPPAPLSSPVPRRAPRRARATSAVAVAAALPSDAQLRADLTARLAAAADPAHRAWLAAYLKGATPVLGVRMGGIRAAVHAWRREHALDARLDAARAKQLGWGLFEGAHEEEKLAGVLYVREALQARGQVGVGDLAAMARLFDAGYIADWNCCDWFCVKVLARVVEEGGAEAVRGVAAWKGAANVWRARAAVVGLIGAVGGEDGRREMLKCCELVTRREERFAKSCVGWALREVASHDKESAFAFMERNAQFLSLESVRNATKHCSAGEKKRFVQLVKEA